MKSIQTLIMAAGLVCAFAVNASAQMAVKEVEKEARLAVNGYCKLFTNTPGCTLMTVPAGKILAVRQFSASCVSNPNTALLQVSLYESGTNWQHAVAMPLTLTGLSPNPVNWPFRVGTASVFFHVPENKQLLGYMTNKLGMADGPADCSIYFDGFLMDKE